MDLRLGRFQLDKLLPVAAGLGGGSSDAAAALRLLARANDLSLDDERLREAARATGADVPVCLDPQGAHDARHRRDPVGAVRVAGTARGAGQSRRRGADQGRVRGACGAARSRRRRRRTISSRSMPTRRRWCRSWRRGATIWRSPRSGFIRHRRRARGAAGVSGLPARAHVRLGRDLLRAVFGIRAGAAAIDVAARRTRLADTYRRLVGASNQDL